MIVVTVGDAKARVEVDLTKALNSLAAAKEGGRKTKAEITGLEAKFALVEVEWESVLLELEASKREVSFPLCPSKQGQGRHGGGLPWFF